MAGILFYFLEEKLFNWEKLKIIIMKTLKRIFTLSVFASIFIFSGCEKDESGDENDMMPKDEAQQVISNTSQQVAKDMEEMQNTNGAKAMFTIDTMFSIHDPLTNSTKGSHNSIISSMNETIQPLEHSKPQ